MGKNIYFCFIDYTKAFDCVDHNKLWEILQEMGIPDHLSYLLRNLYEGQAATVRTAHGTTDWFQMGKGVCQGCILSSCVSNLHAACVHACLVLSNPMDCSPQAPLPRQEYCSRLPISCSRGSSRSRDWTHIWGLQHCRRILYHWATWEYPYMQSTSCEMSGWIRQRLESRLPGEISITSDMHKTPPSWQKVKKDKEPLDEGEGGEWKKLA